MIVVRGQVYRHRKGGVYRIVAVAQRVEEEGGGANVIYENVETLERWSQTEARFMEPGRFTPLEVWQREQREKSA